MVDIKVYPVGILETNCYLITDTESGDMAVVDCGAKSEELLKEINSREKGKVKYILLTHGHFDHTTGVEWLKNETNAQVVISEKENNFTLKDDLSIVERRTFPQKFIADITVNEGDVLDLGRTKISVIETPGHSAGSVCYRIENYLFCGDTIMCETIGRTDLPTGNMNEMAQTLKKLAAIKDDLQLFPGHGEGSTLEHEKKYNAYMRMSYEALYK